MYELIAHQNSFIRRSALGLDTTNSTQTIREGCKDIAHLDCHYFGDQRPHVFESKTSSFCSDIRTPIAPAPIPELKVGDT